MRTPHVAALLLALAPALGTAQSGAAGSRAAPPECAACARDSALDAMHRRRMEWRDRGERLTSIVRELSALRRALAEDEGLSAGDRRRLALRERRLESQLTALERRTGLEVRARALREIGPMVVEARRAAAAGAAVGAEAGVALAHGVTPEGVRFPGWIGITLDAPCTVEVRGDDVFWRFLEHPEIVSVDPSSPADRAGIRQGDVLLAYDGQDVRREIAMNRLLQPGRVVRVRVRVRRANEIRDVPVKVAPARDVTVAHWVRGTLLPATPRPRSPRRGAEAWTTVVPESGQPMVLPEAPVAPSPVIAVRRFAGLAGARMETLTPGLAEAIGVERGVLVMSVAPGVPAHESGLVDGDVILKADGREIGSIRDLSLALARSDERAVKLDVARKGKVRVVTLRW